MQNIKKHISTVRALLIIGAILLIASAIFWCTQVRNSKKQVFSRMLDTSLSSSSSSKVVTQSDESQTLKQRVTLNTAPNQQVQELDERFVPGSGTLVVTESIGTPQADYTRYASIKTNQKSLSGGAYDFSKVIGVWGKSNQNSDISGGAQLYGQTVLSVVPMANLPLQQRKVLIDQINKNKVYDVNYASVKRSNMDGRPVYSYQVKLNPVAYINMLKTFAHDIGMNQLENVDASQYKDSGAPEFTFVVDVWSGQLKAITYSDSNRQESYGSFGARLLIKEPTNPISIDELQKRLSAIQ